MRFLEFILSFKKRILPDVYIFRLKPVGEIIPIFLPGQYIFLRNPQYLPHEVHPYSIASSPLQTEYLEFCIKICGDWTNRLSFLQEGSILHVSVPFGRFVWDNSIKHAVFLLGGIGISPIMSMLRFMLHTNKTPLSLTMLYGNRTLKTVTYQKELEIISTLLPLKIVNVFSDISDNTPWLGYRGFITKKMIQEQADLQQNPTFFIVGPPIFMSKMKLILATLTVKNSFIKEELIDKIQPEQIREFTQPVAI